MWTPHITVATIVEKDGLFLMVEEGPPDARVYNQPAGHVEKNESIIDAAKRETLEETRWEVDICASLGISRYIAPNGNTYFRHSFVAAPLHYVETATLDPDIAEVHWLSAAQIHERRAQWRSTMVGDDIARYLQGLRFPLALYHEQTQHEKPRRRSM